ncbi:MAG: sulfatase [Planctomycetes bacterium]|nr:sulfatase [Planctomycetota bacterium]
MVRDNSTGQIGRREFLKLGTAAAAAAALETMGLGRAMGQQGTARRPNILYVFSDEHRWCSLPFTEMPQVVAPNMERLAREGTRFDNCCSTSPICIPYRGMLMTGQWPHQSECISNDYFVNGDVIGLKSPTIAQTFKKGGYVTGYVGKWHLRNETAKNAGFDYFKHWLYGDDHWETPMRDIPSGEDFKPQKGYNAIGMTDQALDFIRQHAGGDKPFLMMLSLNPPHWRWDDAPDEFVKLYPEDELPYRPNVTEERYKKDKERLYYQHYHAHITAVDRELGRLMAALKELGIEDDTILIYTSDHGSSFGSNGVGSKGNPFDEAIHVPLIVRWPGRVEAGRVADHNIGTIDLNPTLCGLAGLNAPPECSGQDFSSAVLGKDGPDPESQFILVNNFQRNYYKTQLDPDGSNFFYPYRGVRTKRYTYVVYAEGEWLLYDNQKDPYQLKNLVNDPAYADVRADLRRQLDQWLAKAEDPYIPAEWRELSLPDRIARENRHYSLLPFKRQWDKYKADAVAAHRAKPEAAGKEKDLQAAADRVFDEAFFGRYKALHNELNGQKRWSKRPLDELRTELAAHEKKAAEAFKAEVDKLLATAG